MAYFISSLLLALSLGQTELSARANRGGGETDTTQSAQSVESHTTRPIGSSERLVGQSALRSSAVRTPDRQSSASTLATLWQGAWPLAIVLGLIAALALGVRRFMPRASLPGGGIVEVVARQPLSARQSLVLVRLGRQMALLGVSGDRMECVLRIDSREEAASMLGTIESRRDGSRSQTFRELLHGADHEFDRSNDRGGECERIVPVTPGLQRLRVALQQHASGTISRG